MPDPITTRRGRRGDHDARSMPCPSRNAGHHHRQHHQLHQHRLCRCARHVTYCYEGLSLPGERSHLAVACKQCRGPAYLPRPPAHHQAHLRRPRRRDDRRGHRFLQPRQQPVSAGWLAHPGRRRPSPPGKRRTHPQRLRRTHAHHAPRRDPQARSDGGGGPGRWRSAQARLREVPATIPAAARCATRQHSRHGNPGLDPQFRRLPACLHPDTDLTSDTRIGPAVSSRSSLGMPCSRLAHQPVTISLRTNPNS
jgi:hypothetical protein